MTLYRHFVSKEQLFKALIEDLCNQMVTAEVTREMDILPIEQALRTFANRIIAVVFHPDTVKLHRIVIAEGPRFPEISEYFWKQGPQRAIDLLADYFSRNIEHPKLRVPDPAVAAQEFLSLLRGYQHMRLLLALPVPADEDHGSLIDSAINHVLN